MSVDGAAQGFRPKDAMQAVVAGKAPEHEPDPVDLQEMIDAVPDNVDLAWADDHGLTGYDMACMIVAKGIKKFLMEHTEYHEIPAEGSYDYDDAGKFVQTAMGLADVMEVHEVDPYNGIEGITAFQWGWSVNAARAGLGLGSQPNPAMVMIVDGKVVPATEEL